MRPTLTNLASLIRTNMPTLKRVVVGQDNEPKMDDLPQAQVYPQSTIVNLSGTVKDMQQRAITIRIIDSVKSKLNQTASGIDTVSSVLFVADLMEKKAASGAFSTASVLGVLRNNPTVNGQQFFVDEMGVDYTSFDGLGFPNAVSELNCVFTVRNLTK